MLTEHPVLIVTLSHWLVCLVAAMIINLKMLSIFKSKGYSVFQMWINPIAIFELNEIIKEEKEINNKKKYQVVFWAQIALIPYAILGMIIISFIF